MPESQLLPTLCYKVLQRSADSAEPGNDCFAGLVSVSFVRLLEEVTHWISTPLRNCLVVPQSSLLQYKCHKAIGPPANTSVTILTTTCGYNLQAASFNYQTPNWFDLLTLAGVYTFI